MGKDMMISFRGMQEVAPLHARLDREKGAALDLLHLRLASGQIYFSHHRMSIGFTGRFITMSTVEIKGLEN